MPRDARIVAPGRAHHVAQRGTNRQTVFHPRRGRQLYLQLLQESRCPKSLVPPFRRGRESEFNK